MQVCKWALWMSEAAGGETSEMWVLALRLLPDKGVAQPMLNLAQEPGESWMPINISYKGQRVFRFFLNSKGFDTERIQASLLQQCLPRSQSLQLGFSGDSQSQGKLCCVYSVATCPHYSSVSLLNTWGTLSGLTSGEVGTVSSFLFQLIL